MENKSENSPETFLLFNEVIGTIQTVNMQYNDKTKQMCDSMVFMSLAKAYSIKDVYNRVLQSMIDNDIYERYLPSILELQFNPPEQQTSNGSDDGTQSSSGEEKSSNSKGNVKTKREDDNKRISKLFIENLFKEDEDN